MKVLSIGLALALPVIAGCGQALNQSSLPSGAASSMQSAVSLGRVHPDFCNFKNNATSSGGGFLKWKQCGLIVGRMTYGPGSTGGLNVSTQPYKLNPGSVPVPPGEQPVIFMQMQVLPQSPGPASFTAPTVPPNSNRSRITSVPIGDTYKLYAYDNSFTPIAGFPIILGSPTAGGTLFFNGPSWSPLPLLGSVPVGASVWFELTKP